MADIWSVLGILGMSLLGLVVVTAVACGAIYVLTKEDRNAFLLQMGCLTVCALCGIALFIVIESYALAIILALLLVFGICAETSLAGGFREAPFRVENFGAITECQQQAAGMDAGGGPTVTGVRVKAGEAWYDLPGDEKTVQAVQEGGDLVAFYFTHNWWPWRHRVRYAVLPQGQVAGDGNSGQPAGWGEILKGIAFLDDIKDLGTTRKLPWYRTEGLMLAIGGVFFIGFMFLVDWETKRDVVRERQRQVARAELVVTMANTTTVRPQRQYSSAMAAFARPDVLKINEYSLKMARYLRKARTGRVFHYPAGFSCFEIRGYERMGFGRGSVMTHPVEGHYCWPDAQAPAQLARVAQRPYQQTADFASTLHIVPDSQHNVTAAVADFTNLGISCLFDDQSNPIGCWDTDKAPDAVVQVREAAIVVPEARR